ncbi:MAG: carbon-nitrogen family hydrolase [Chloroflexi bacterium]|jgi:omega-amidase|nr:carbon-nitrogen family hydrolase [Chloroflexota bacterium]
MELQISLVQLAFEFGDVEENFDRASAQIAEAAASGSQLVLLPELWNSGFDLENRYKYATKLNEGSFARLSALARGHNMAIGCSFLEKDSECNCNPDEDDCGVFNTFVLFGPNGTLWADYRKTHLFRLLKEDQYLCAGDYLGYFQIPEWGTAIGLSICYDLRFPELFRVSAARGAKLMLVVAEWPEKRIEHWRSLLRARAIENQFFVAAVNKVGESQTVKLGGHSAVISPTGGILVEGGDSGALLTAKINLEEVDDARREIPVLEDRREDLYCQWE